MKINNGPRFYSAPPLINVFGLQVKVTDFDFSCLSFVLKFLRSLYNSVCLFSWVDVWHDVDIGPKFYSVPPQPMRQGLNF